MDDLLKMPIPFKTRQELATGVPSGFLSIGHRGASGHAPENTRLAMDTAVRLGAQWVEFDVQRHGDTLLVFHDDRVDRTTDGHGRLLELSLETIRQLDAGRGETIPTLQEMLDHIDRRVGVNIELKSFGGTAAAVASVLREYVDQRGWAPDQFLVSSFHLRELREFRRLAPTIPTAVLLCGVPLDLAACATEIGAVAINLAADFVDAELVADARSRGLKVYVYTVNYQDDIEQLRGFGIDGVFTDYPERAVFVDRAA